MHKQSDVRLTQHPSIKPSSLTSPTRNRIQLQLLTRQTRCWSAQNPPYLFRWKYNCMGGRYGVRPNAQIALRYFFFFFFETFIYPATIEVYSSTEHKLRQLIFT